ncbi:MAG: type II CRISPR RNA-guided endonuclease Cas9 [Clostridia bacterium]|nr:type II CRISPR RNA-guided endonuclease Cas9 [Clostridia bacterium]
MKYRLGLDIGIASVGWSVMEVNYDGEPIKIGGLGSRIFEKAETADKGESPAMARRLARGARRRLRRRALRLVTAKKLIMRSLELDNIALDSCVDMYELRLEALDKAITGKEFALVLLSILKHRGFKSNRKSESTKEETGALLSAISNNEKYRKEKGYRTVGEMYAKDERFVSIRDGVKLYAIRNKSEQYSKTIAQDELLEEIKILFAAQRAFGNELAAEEFEEKFIKIFTARREFDEGPGEPSPYRNSFNVGKCVFENQELRAPKASFTFEYTNVLIKLNNLRIKYAGEERILTVDEKEKILLNLKSGKKGEMTFEQLKKLLKIEREAKFNALTYSDAKNDAFKQIRGIKLNCGGTERYLSPEEKGVLLNELTEKGELNSGEIIDALNIEDSFIAVKGKKEGEFKLKLKNIEGVKFISMSASSKIIAELSPEHKVDIDLIDEIALLLSMNKSDAKLLKSIADNPLLSSLSQSEIEGLMKLSFSKFGSVSVKALKKIQPYVAQGMRYDEACSAAGYNFRAHSNGLKLKLLNSQEINDIIRYINVPVVRRAVSQTIKVINAIIRNYGSPIAVNVELARELSKTYGERMRIKRDNDVRAEENQKIMDYIRDTFHIAPRGLDLVKYRLYEEQFGKCAYSQTPIDANRLFEPTYLQIDHIIPYSRSFNDSYNNKVLVLLEENQAKKNMLPYEYMGKDENRWKTFEAYVKATYKSNPNKTEMLLRKTFTKENEKEWQERSLNDTKYISRFMFNLINDYLLLDDNINIGKKRVTAVNGAITSYLRKMWGIEKIRTDGDLHHAKDAAIIACVTDRMIKAVTDFNKGKETMFKGQSTYTDMYTGEIITREEYDKSYGGGDKLKAPYNGFPRELKLRLMPSVEDYREKYYKLGYEEEEIDSLKPVFVSRMPTRKAKGRMHKDTIRSAKCLDDGLVISKTDIKKLKLNKDGEIDNYYIKDKQDDKLLYEALRAQLAAYGGDGAAAFKDVFYKPKSDGTSGNPVRKVRLTEKSTLEVRLSKIEGAAGNTSIVRTDIFYKDKKYYSVPVYVSDVYKSVLPNKAIEAGKPYREWPDMNEGYEFLFSLYPNDLVYVEHKKGINLVKNDETKQKLIDNNGYFYFGGIDISSGAAIFDNHDQSYFTRLGLKTLPVLKKCTVDVLGNITFVGKEKRLALGS